MGKFKEIDSRLNLPKQEEEILRFWDTEKIFQASLDLRKDKKPFVFFEGPPTANAKPGMHHLISRYLKDFFARYKTMRGFLVERKAGWDTHGLPVEIAVEKLLNISSKPEIEKYGVAEFNAKARSSVWEYKDLWEKFSRRSAYWLDFDNPYITYDPKYVESVWWVLKQIWDKNYIYQGHKVVPYCPRCGTALSSHEVAQGYQEVEDHTIFVKFKLKNAKDTYLVAWTTTPWTLPGNSALAVDAKIDYVMVEKDNEKLILAKTLVEKVLGSEMKIIKEFKGKKLVGSEYDPLFEGAIPENSNGYENAFKVYPAKFVTTEEGTGIVHIAPMYGEDDYQIGEQFDLPKVHTVSENGKFLPSVAKWAGRAIVKDNKKDPELEGEIVDDLKNRGLILSELNYKHDYPFCWRCSSPLLYYAMDSWFIKMSNLRKQLIKNNKKINWVPEHLKEGRFGEWLKEAKDWAISRARYWGTPLPIWKNEDGDIIFVGSYEELRGLAEKPELVGNNFDPHRPTVDEIVLIKNGKKYFRVPEILDVWFDSGAMPYAQWHYPFENKDRIDAGKSFPADFIAEGIDQTRGWFYTLLAISTLLDKGPAYKNVVVNGHLLDKQGKKMSKSKGNVVDPWHIFENYGSDALRWYLFAGGQPSLPKNFDEEGLKQVLRRFVLTLWNTLSFFTTYANLDNFKPKSAEPKPDNILDKWIMARVNETGKEVTNYLEKYNVTNSALSIEKLVDDLSNWYVRRSRKRFWKSENVTDQKQAYATLYWSLKNISMLLAPFMPMLSEIIFDVLKTEKDAKSVHLMNWPKFKPADNLVLEQMEIARKLVETGHFLREQAKIKVRQPLASMKTVAKDLPEDILRMLADELNVKKIIQGSDKDELDTVLTEELLQEGMAREIVRAIQALRKDSGLKVEDRIILFYASSDEAIEKTFVKFGDYIKGETLAVEAEKDAEKANLSAKINDKEVKLGLKKK